MTLSIATFNVKDLLPPRDDREREILPAKLDWIAATIRACDADVVGLQEIGPPELLRGVVERLDAAWARTEPAVGTPDARGIRCALVARVPVLEARVHTSASLPFPAFVAGDPPPFGARIPLRRGVVQARVDAPGIGPVEVFVAHFKSSRPVGLRDAGGGAELPPARARDRAEGRLRSLVWRAAEALHLRGLVDAVLAASPHARVAVTGDLNDVPDSVVARILRADDPPAADSLFDCASRVDRAARFSAMHDGARTQIDHVLVSRELYARLQSAVFLNAALRQHPPLPTTAAKNEEPGGASLPPTVDSDHAPLVARFG